MPGGQSAHALGTLAGSVLALWTRPAAHLTQMVAPPPLAVLLETLPDVHVRHFAAPVAEVNFPRGQIMQLVCVEAF